MIKYGRVSLSMTNFFRVVRMGLRYRGTLALSLTCSLLIGLLWGGNIGALHPVLEVVFKGRSLQDWIDSEIDQALAQSVHLESEIADLQRQLRAAPPAERAALEADIAQCNDRLGAERQALKHSRLVRPYIHRYLPDDPFQTVVLIVGLLLVSTLVKDACIVANLTLTARLVQRVAFDLRDALFRQVLRMDPRTFDEKGAGGYAGHFDGDIYGITGGLSSLFGTAVREPLKMICCAAGAALICWRLFLITMVLAPLSIWIVRWLAMKVRKATSTALEEGVYMNRYVVETFLGVRAVQAFTMEHAEQGRLRRCAAALMRRTLKITFYNALTKPATELLGIGAVSLGLIVGAHLVLNNQTHLLGIPICDRPLSLASLLVFFGLLIGMSDPARKMSEIFSNLQVGCAAADRFFGILDRPPLVTSPSDPRPLPPLKTLTLENISFGYKPDEPVLTGIDLTLKRGQTIALVGPNGCGKSTLANLVLRFFDPDDGRVLWEGVDLRDASLEDLRRRIAIVAQQTTLFDDTIENNIRYGSPAATHEQILDAARRARADEFIEQRPGGYQTTIGPGGGQLSGGQRQRLALARAILRDPELLILDEATSQIDAQSERLIHQSLTEFVTGRIAIVISHRPAVLDLADQIVVLDNRRVAGVGRHEQLLQRCPQYQSFHTANLRKSA